MVIRLSISLILLMSAAAAQPTTCFVDKNLDGFFDQIDETDDCDVNGLCPLDKTACTIPAPVPELICPSGGYLVDNCGDAVPTCTYLEPCFDDAGLPVVCPEPIETVQACILDPDPPTPPAVCPLVAGGACIDDGTGTEYCSSPCHDVPASGGYTDQSRPREYIQDDGATDGSGACLDEIRFFEGFAMDCRPVGLQTVFKNCCQDRGKIITDTQGAEGQTPGLPSAAPILFGGLGAAYGAFTSGASSSSAAGVGTSFLGLAFDPTSIALASAFTLMVDLLDLGCDAQDMETGVLRGSGMCHYIDDYCSLNSPFGCVQKKRAHCCFNSKLARIIHEQGRPQLASFFGLPNGGWGTAEVPHCRGFTQIEFQSLDFGQMDLSEYYTELSTRTAAEMQVIMQTEVDEYADDNGI